MWKHTPEKREREATADSILNAKISADLSLRNFSYASYACILYIFSV